MGDSNVARLFALDLFDRPWGASMWKNIILLTPPSNQRTSENYVSALYATSKQRGRLEAVMAMLARLQALFWRADAQSEQPALVIMVAKTPISKTHAEANALRKLCAAIQIIENAGHSPHAEMLE